MLQRESELEGVSTLSTLNDLPHPTQTSVSIITPPAVSALFRCASTFLDLKHPAILGDARTLGAGEGSVHPCAVAPAWSRGRGGGQFHPGERLG